VKNSNSFCIKLDGFIFFTKKIIFSDVAQPVSRRNTAVAAAETAALAAWSRTTVT